LSACSSSQKSRNIASSDVDISGTILGVVKHTEKVRRPKNHGPRGGTGWKTVTVNKYRAARIYLNEIESEKGSYHAIILEYVNLVGMAPKYIISNKATWLAKKVGFLNQIAKRIAVYKVTPGQEQGTYEMQKLQVVGDKIEPANGKNPSQLILSETKVGDHVLSGARITAAADGEPVELYFPYKDDKEHHGIQYGLAQFTYKKVKLDSTWRKDFLSGPYLGAYGDKADVVLDLVKTENGPAAKFLINKDRVHLSERKRERQFTNAKSAYIEGDYTVSEPEDGMFVFQSVERDQMGVEHVRGKIGLFIDIFDATKSLNQDVVELVLVDSAKPEDFLMYYEHPDNGEGSK
jgi:hypothetical protein